MCLKIAKELMRISNGKLELVGIYTKTGNELLVEAMPNGWDHKPYLIAKTNGKVYALSTLSTGFRIISLLGFEKGFQLCRIFYWHRYFSRERINFSPQRRNFIQNLGSLTLAAILSPQIFAQSAESTDLRDRIQVSGELYNGFLILSSIEQALTIEGSLLDRENFTSYRYNSLSEIPSYIFSQLYLPTFLPAGI